MFLFQLVLKEREILNDAKQKLNLYIILLIDITVLSLFLFSIFL